jgi:integrase
MCNARESANAWRQIRHQLSLHHLTLFGDHLTPAVLRSMNTGLRCGELPKLRWAGLNFNRRLLAVEGRNAKNRQTRHVPLKEEAMSVLRRWREQSGGSAKLLDVAARFQSAWKKQLLRARVSHFGWQDLRHPFPRA